MTGSGIAFYNELTPKLVLSFFWLSTISSVIELLMSIDMLPLTLSLNSMNCMETVRGEEQGEKVMLVLAASAPLHMMPVQSSFIVQLVTLEVFRRAIRVPSASHVSLHCICALASAMAEKCNELWPPIH